MRFGIAFYIHESVPPMLGNHEKIVVHIWSAGSSDQKKPTAVDDDFAEPGSSPRERGHNLPQHLRGSLGVIENTLLHHSGAMTKMRLPDGQIVQCLRKTVHNESEPSPGYCELSHELSSIAHDIGDPQIYLLYTDQLLQGHFSCEK